MLLVYRKENPSCNACKAEKGSQKYEPLFITNSTYHFHKCIFPGTFQKFHSFNEKN